MNLAPEVFVILVVPSPELVLGTVNLSSLQLNSDSVVWLGGEDNVLVLRIRVLLLLLIGTHKAHSGYRSRLDVWVLDLEEDAILSRDRVPDLSNAVAWTANRLKVPFDLSTSKESKWRGFILLAFSLFHGISASQVSLVFPSLGMREVGAVILVDSQAEAALEASDVVFEDVRIFLEIDGFKRKLAETFAPVCISRRCRGNASTAEPGARTVLHTR